MSDILILRFDAPLVSFGGPAVDNYRVVQAWPAASMVTGLVGNALGYDHREFERLQRLQQRLRYVVRCDRPGSALQDYQTVNLGDTEMLPANAGWTTWGRVEERGGSGDNKTGTHIRYRDYRADSIHTLALTLDPAAEHPTIDDLERALMRPERPLFIGRKCCLPAGPILVRRLLASSLITALASEPRVTEARTNVEPSEPLSAWWPEGETHGPVEQQRAIAVSDERDWSNQVHCGNRLLHHGLVRSPEVSDG